MLIFLTIKSIPNPAKRKLRKDTLRSIKLVNSMRVIYFRF